jgi:DNA-binding transcriptional ArsR family regulator/uncharacterized protein YndB with AHSA1/START domain
MEDVQVLLAAINSPVRRRIVRLVWDHELPAGAIAAACGVSAPTASEHLGLLRRAGLVIRESRGTFRLYRVDQDAVRSIHHVLAGSPDRWTAADDIPEAGLTSTGSHPMVTVEVTAGCDQATAFRAFTDPAVYSRWMGVPVTIEDGRFSCTLEWGTHVAGVYEVVHPPSLIALRWSFDDGAVPVPGADLVGYMRFHPVAGGCRVEVHQLVDTPDHAPFMESAWGMVLGRFATGVTVAITDGVVLPTRSVRPKRRGAAAPDAG